MEITYGREESDCFVEGSIGWKDFATEKNVVFVKSIHLRHRICEQRDLLVGLVNQIRPTPQ